MNAAGHSNIPKIVDFIAKYKKIKSHKREINFAEIKKEKRGKYPDYFSNWIVALLKNTFSRQPALTSFRKKKECTKR